MEASDQSINSRSIQFCIFLFDQFVLNAIQLLYGLPTILLTILESFWISLCSCPRFIIAKIEKQLGFEYIKLY